MAITVKPTGYTVNTGHAKCPNHLYMLDDATGATNCNDGVGTLDLTADSTSMWATDGSYGQILRFDSASSQKALSAASFSASTGVLVVFMIKTASAVNPGADSYAGGVGSTVAGSYGGLRYLATTGYAGSSWRSNSGTTNLSRPTVDYYDNTWRFIAVKTSDTTGSDSVEKISIDGAAWTGTRTAGSGDVDVAYFTRIGLGCNPQATPILFFNGDILAAFVYKDDYSTWDDTWIAALYADPWQFLETSALTSQQPQLYRRPNTLLRM